MPDWLDTVSEWADVMQLVGVPLAVVALFFAWRQLRMAARTGRVQIALALDANLSEFEDVRSELAKTNPQIPDSVRLRRYIAALERVGYALRLKEIPLKVVDQFYGGRFAKLVKHEDALAIAKDRDGWEEFYYLWERLVGYNGNKRGIVDPPMSS